MQRLIDCSDATEAARRDRLEQLVAGYHQFLAHDLANQLVPIQGFARLLVEQLGEAEPEARLLLNRLADLTRRVDQRARRFAEFGRVLREPAAGSSINLADVVAESVAEVKAAPRATDLATGVAIDVVQQTVMARASRRLLNWALIELLHNCVAARATRVEVAAARNCGVWLTIHDNGGGIAEPLLSRLGAISAAGSGLGWFFVVQAVASWRGQVAVRSDSGQGTTVSLLLPDHDA
jgi:signal transduction histidine kinase